MYLSRTIRALCVFLSTFIVVSTLPLSALRADNEKIKCYSVVEENKFEVEEVTTSIWDGHANIELRIRNIGEKVIDNWHLTFNTPYFIENIWNASIIETDNNGTYTIRNDYYDQDIETDSVVTIGMTITISDVELGNFADWYLLNTKIYEVESDRYLISYQEYSKWNDGYNGALMLSSTDYIEDWSMRFDSEYEITSISNADIVSADNRSYSITNDGVSQNLSPNTLVMSIQGVPTENDFVINNVLLTSIGLAYGLSDDEDNNGIADYLDYIFSAEDNNLIAPTPTEETTITPAPSITDETTIEPTEVEIITTEPTITEVPTSLYDISEVDDCIDSDKDGLTDYEELLFGTNPNNPDSDYDYVSDYDEVYIGYDPNKVDSNDNGVIDGEEDFDLDGISNKDEYDFGTCIYLSDSDFDEINDFDELFIYITNPINKDSNNDGLLDGDAVALGFDPALFDTDNDGIPDIEEKIYQVKELDLSFSSNIKGVSSVEVCGEFTNRISTTMLIHDMYGIDTYSSNIDALVGGLVSIETYSDFDSATIVFHYDETSLNGVDEDDLCILWYDEQNGEYVMLYDEQIVDKEKNTVSYTTNHFSEYMLISMSDWYKSWETSINEIIELQNSLPDIFDSGKREYVTLMQLSLGDDMYDVRTKEQSIFANINQAMDNDKYSMFGFGFYGDYLRVFPCMGNRDYAWLECLKRIYDMNLEPGPVDMDYIISCIPQLLSYCSDNPVIFLITDNDVNVDSDTVELLNNSPEFELHIISLNGASVSGLDEYNYTGYTYLDSDSILHDIQSNVDSDFENPLSLYADYDGDGLSNYQEYTGFLLSNGTHITTDWQNEDSDFDSNDDGNATLCLWNDKNELGEYKSLTDLSLANSNQFATLFGQYVDKIYCWDYVSNPIVPDTDGDDVIDCQDARPKIKNPIKVYIFSSSTASFNNVDSSSTNIDTDIDSRASVLATKYKALWAVESFTGITTTMDFLKCWNQIGLNNGYGDKIYYAPIVVIVTHGSSRFFSLSDDACICVSGYSKGKTDSLAIQDLPPKAITKLCLYTCNGGAPVSYQDNIASCFVNSFSCIDTVIAFDTFLFEDTNSYYGVWYKEDKTISKDEYDSIKWVNGPGIDKENRYYVHTDITTEGGYVNREGFKAFRKESDPIEIFDSDMVYGFRLIYDGISSNPTTLKIQADLSSFSYFSNDPLTDNWK